MSTKAGKRKAQAAAVEAAEKVLEGVKKAEEKPKRVKVLRRTRHPKIHGLLTTAAAIRN